MCSPYRLSKVGCKCSFSLSESSRAVSYFALSFTDLPLKPGLDFCRVFFFLKEFNMSAVKLLLSFMFFRELLALSGR